MAGHSKSNEMNIMKQLKLTEKELTDIGFEKCTSKADRMNPPKTYFKLKTINGYFYYNPMEDVYTWYHKTVLGNNSNSVHLDITFKPELFVLLKCFRVKCNLGF